jgi:hypothetical protein
MEPGLKHFLTGEFGLRVGVFGVLLVGQWVGRKDGLSYTGKVWA